MLARGSVTGIAVGRRTTPTCSVELMPSSIDRAGPSGVVTQSFRLFSTNTSNHTRATKEDLPQEAHLAVLLPLHAILAFPTTVTTYIHLK